MTCLQKLLVVSLQARLDRLASRAQLLLLPTQPLVPLSCLSLSPITTPVFCHAYCCIFFLLLLCTCADRGGRRFGARANRSFGALEGMGVSQSQSQSLSLGRTLTLTAPVTTWGDSFSALSVKTPCSSVSVLSVFSQENNNAFFPEICIRSRHSKRLRRFRVGGESHHRRSFGLVMT